MKFEIHNRIEVEPTFRTAQVAGMFDLSADHSAEFSLAGELPLQENPWQIGLIVGPSGSGKSTLARELFNRELITDYKWPKTKAILDGFPKELDGKQIVQALSAVGFSSPPSWLKPFHCLSNGEQFRVTLARALASSKFCVVDEFTSVVDRTVAQIGSAAVSKAVRRDPDRKFVAVSCHYDILDWLSPDWVFEPDTGEFSWRCERRSRPPIRLEISRCHRDAWQWFRHHHYLDTNLHKGAACFLGTVQDRPAAFTAVLSSPHGRVPGGYWREHRTVCLPDFQGVGIGNAISEFVASLFCWHKAYHSTTGHPAMIHYRAKSPLWKLTKKPGINSRSTEKEGTFAKRRASNRITAAFRYVGPAANKDICRELVPNLFKKKPGT